MRMLAVFALALYLTACATSYQPESFFSGGGYSDSQLDKDVFRISFNGNEYTSANRAEEMALLRSAELTMKNGYAYFAILDEHDQTNYQTYTTPIRSTTTGSNQIITGGQTHMYAMPSTTSTIKCFKDKPDTNQNVYDARFVFNSLAQKYGVVASR
jgi:hypothetical protein